MTTTVAAAAQWTGQAFDVGTGDIPQWLADVWSASGPVISGEVPAMIITLTTTGGPVALNPTDWVFVTGAGATGLGVATDADFHSNYEIAAS